MKLSVGTDKKRTHHTITVFLFETLNNQDPILCVKSIILEFIELMNVVQNSFNAVR